MQRSAILTVTLLSALGLTFVACTQDFNQFEPTGGSGGAAGGSGGASSSSSGEVGGAGGMGSSSTSSSSTSSSTTASSSSSSSGGMPCNNSGDCPNDTPCRNWSCMMGMCGFTDVANGSNAPAMYQMAGDCKVIKCDGNGNDSTANDNADTPPTDGNPCTDQTCSNGTPMFPNRPPGTACNGGVCNDNGMCVECLVDGDCGAGQTCYVATNTCVSCTDGMKNGDETGIDCGGSCKKCDGDACAAGADCSSANCADGYCCDTACTGTCKACNIAGKLGTCSNIAVNMEDTNATMTCMTTSACDGAGTCKLKNDQTCINNADCLSNNCMTVMGNKLCQP